MDITQLTTTELKALVYDTSMNMAIEQKRIDMLNTEISKREGEEVKK